MIKNTGIRGKKDNPISKMRNKMLEQLKFDVAREANVKTKLREI